MKKALLTVLAAFAIVVFISSCEPDNEQANLYEESIDNGEVEDDDI